MMLFITNVGIVLGVIVQLCIAINFLIVNPIRHGVHNVINPLNESINNLQKQIDKLREQTEMENQSVEKRLAEHDVELAEHEEKIHTLFNK